MKLRLIYLSILLIFGCNHVEKKDQSELTEKLKIDTSKVAVLTYDPNNLKHKVVFDNCVNTELANNDLNKIDLTLEKIIAKQNIQQKKDFPIISQRFPEENYKLEDFIIRKNDYNRQYIVVLNQNGEKEAWVNLFRSDAAGLKDFNWKTIIVWAHGGGTMFFNFKINLTTNKYYEVWFNAEA
jgi:AAA15 family ATPase/GTPase